MDRQRIKEQQKSLLGELLGLYREDDIAAMIVPDEENGVADTLTVQHLGIGAETDEILGEYAFLFVDGGENAEPDIHAFVCSLTLTEELDGKKSERIGYAIGKINYYLPLGAFLLSPDRTALSYRCSALFSTDWDGDRQKVMALLYMEKCARTVSEWADILDALEYGRMDVKAFDAELEKRYSVSR